MEQGRPFRHRAKDPPPDAIIASWRVKRSRFTTNISTSVTKPRPDGHAGRLVLPFQTTIPHWHSLSKQELNRARRLSQTDNAFSRVD